MNRELKTRGDNKQEGLCAESDFYLAQVSFSFIHGVPFVPPLPPLSVCLLTTQSVTSDNVQCDNKTCNYRPMICVNFAAK